LQVASTEWVVTAKETEAEVEFLRETTYGVQLTKVSSPAGAMFEEHS
jgi:hypothetical protein